MMLVSILIKTNENLENSYMKSSAKEDYHKRRKELFFSSHTCLNLISRSMPMEKYPEIDGLLTKQDLKEFGLLPHNDLHGRLSKGNDGFSLLFIFKD